MTNSAAKARFLSTTPEACLATSIAQPTVASSSALERYCLVLLTCSFLSHVGQAPPRLGHVPQAAGHLGRAVV